MIVAITGGIGSGKSVVSQVLRLLDYPVYDCDANAKRLMNESVALRESLVKRFGTDLYRQGAFNAQYLSSIVFADQSALADLNAIVHPAVKADIQDWWRGKGGLVFVETAIPYSSGVNQIVDKIWKVTAPTEVRVERVMARNGMTRLQVEQRIASQASEEVQSDKDVVIINDGTTAVIPQIVENLNLLKSLYTDFISS